MKTATTTCDFNGYCSTYEEKIMHLHKAGFKNIDINIYNNDETAIFRAPDWKEYTLKLKEYAESLGMKFVQAHSPGYANPFVFDEKREMLIKDTIRSIEVCDLLGIKNTVVHTGWEKGLSRNEAFDKNMKFINELIPAMEKHEVNVLIENSTFKNMPENMCYFYAGCHIKEFLEYAKHPLLHAVWDTGHSNADEHLYKDIIDLGEDLYALHVHDNRSNRDEHMMPFTGTLNTDELMCALIESGYKGYFTFESTNILTRHDYWLGQRRKFDKDTRTLNPSIELMDMAEKLLYETGKYILSAYNCFEE